MAEVIRACVECASRDLKLVGFKNPGWRCINCGKKTLKIEFDSEAAYRAFVESKKK